MKCRNFGGGSRTFEKRRNIAERSEAKIYLAEFILTNETPGSATELYTSEDI